MIFGKPNKNLKFVFSEINLINTDQYTYLDIKFQPNGSFTKCIDDRLLKANRAIYVLKQALSTTRNVNVKLARSLFNKQIELIISYGCVNWSLPKASLYTHIRNIPNDLSINTIKDTLETNNINYVTCKRVGKCNMPCRSVLVQCCSFNDKIKLLSCNLKDMQ